MIKTNIFCILVLLIVFDGIAQNVFKGKVISVENNEPIPFVTVTYNRANRMTVSNENGEFSLSYGKKLLNAKDSLSFNALGYEVRNIAIEDLHDKFITIKLKQSINEISTVVLSNKEIDAEQIVKNVLENLEYNYVQSINKSKVFCQTLLENNVNYLNIDYKKTTVPWLTKKKMKEIETDIPKHYKNQIGFIGDLYSNTNEDKKRLKLNPSKVLTYESERAEDMDFFTSLMNMFSDTEKKEYWKVKTGVLGKRINNNDSLNKHRPKNTISSKSLKWSLNNGFKFEDFENEKKWGFLHKTYKYDYSVIGDVVLNDEEVYRIGFKPKRNADYIGEMYISKTTFALVKAHYKQVDDKSTSRIKLLGFLKEIQNYEAAVVFEKKGDKYVLKQFSYFIEDIVGIDRKVAFQKKKERFLFDKKLEEIKIDLKFKLSQKTFFDYLVLENEEIGLDVFETFKEKKSTKFLKTNGNTPIINSLLPLLTIQEIEMHKN